MTTSGPVGRPTRGTTGVNRLRRGDRWLVHHTRVRNALLAVPDPIVVDLGFGASPVTTVELAARLGAVRPGVRVVGVEIDRERVRVARELTGWSAATGRDPITFAHGGFELAGLRPVLVRAFNVLRQYDVTEVPGAWASLRERLAPGGLILEGTCDELGRRCAWVLLDGAGPLTLTLACDPFAIHRPSDLAERLPKILIHQNIPGQRVHALLDAADRAWDAAAGYGVFGPRVRWQAMSRGLCEAGWPVHRQRRRLRDAVLTVPWSEVAPDAPDRDDGPHD